MHIFPPELEIGPTEGFDPKKDIFKRAEFGKGLTNLVRSVADPIVIAVDGPWGCGKTTFLKMWAGELRKEGFPVVYFDAFANDYAEDSFTAIASEIIGLVDEHKKSNNSKAKKFVKKATDAGKVVLRSSLKVGVKVGTLGALNTTDLSDFAEAVAGEASEVTDKYLGELLTKQNQRKLTIEAFRDALAELPLLLQVPAEAPKVQDKPKPLIFIIDELDRCRPAFALETLERIKHFFSVPNVHFVLGTHLAQLQNSVVVAYGPQVDAQTYLEKFIHLTFLLIGKGGERHERVTGAYINHLVSTFEFKAYDNRVVELSVELIKDVAERRDLGLRTLQRIFSTLVLALEFADERRLKLAPILAGLGILKVIFPELYRKAKEGLLTYPEVKEALGLGTLEEGKVTSRVEWATGWWRYCTDRDVDDALIGHYGKDISKYHFSDRFDIVPFTANEIIDRLIPRVTSS